MSWAKLNHLISEPQCDTKTKDGVFTISNWKDSRPQPSMAEIDDVTDADVEASEEQKLEDEFVFGDAQQITGKALFDLWNRVLVLEGKNPISRKKAIKDMRKL